MRESPKYPVNLDSVERAERIAAMAQGNLENAAVNALEWLRLIGFSALRRDREGVENIALRLAGKILEVPARRLNP